MCLFLLTLRDGSSATRWPDPGFNERLRVNMQTRSMEIPIPMPISRQAHFTTPMDFLRRATEESKQARTPCVQERCRRIFVTQSFHGGEPPAIPAVPAPVSLSQLKRPVTNWNTRERNDDMAFRVYPWPPVNMYREFHNRCSRTLSQLKDPSRTQP